jgi:hypothetical protein
MGEKGSGKEAMRQMKQVLQDCMDNRGQKLKPLSVNYHLAKFVKR